jgi:threonine/homoserine/homoserine lactone efflux protein
VLTAALAFAAAALLLTLTPGLDTMFVVRTSLANGPATGLVGGLGVCLGTLAWGAASAAGITALLVASKLGYDVLRIAGAGYLTYVGLRMLWSSRTQAAAVPLAAGRTVGRAEAFRTGLFTNLLNPKVGVFYITLLPQFVPPGTARLAAFGFSVLLAAIHAVEGIAWFALLAAGLARVRRLLARPGARRALDRVTGVVFLGFGARIALEGRRLTAG